ncbi:MAG: DUF2520 domain-containing protein [Actinomycetota bacterium]
MSGPAATTFTVIGPGRAGHAFATALVESGWRLHALLGRQDDLRTAAAGVDVVLLAVPDERISAVAAAVEPGPAAVVHLSGATGLDALAPHRHRGSVHPLVSLPDGETGARRLVEGAVFAVDGHPAAQAVVTALGGTAVAVPDDRRALYHATAAVAANHLVVLCAQVERLAAEVGVPVAAYWQLMAATLDNVRSAGALSSLTGPAARGDRATVARHLGALPADEVDLYRVLSQGAAALAGRRGAES